jgi:hypothetical protein
MTAGATRLIFLIGLGLVGTCATQLVRYRFLPLAKVLRWEAWDSLSIAGIVAGMLGGHVLWMLAEPLRRVSRATAICVVANAMVWASFLIFSSPLATAEFQRIAEERARRDADPGGMDLTTDRPIVVAGRWHGTFGALNFPDRLLSLFAAPAIGFADLLVVPVRYSGLDATKGESFAIAGLGFLLSTVFWATVGGAVSSLTRAFGKSRSSTASW